MMRAALIVFLLFGGLACTSDQERAKELYDRGTALWESESKTTEAQRAFERGLELDPKHVEMRMKLARIFYEEAEDPHLQERRLLAESLRAEESKDMALAARLRIQADDKKREATAAYRACIRQLDTLVENGEGEKKLLAHAHYLRFRAALFLEEWKVAKISLRQSIELGDLTGLRRAKWEEFLHKLESESPKALIDRDRTALDRITESTE